MDDDARQAHRNLCDFIRWYKVLDPTASELDAHDVLAVAYGVDWPSTRQAIRTGEEVSAEGWVEEAHDFLMQHGNTGCVFLREEVDDEVAEVLEAWGYEPYERTPELICRRPVDEVEPGADQEIRLVETADDVTTFAAIAGRAFTALGIPEEPSTTLLDKPDVVLGDDVVVALGTLAGEPVAAALALQVDEGRQAYVGWVSCLEAARGQGLGDRVTRRVTNESFARGAGLVTLEASRFGDAIYRRMGYEEAYWYRLWITM